MPEARQNSSKLAEMFDRASSFNALVGMAVDVVSLFMALLSSVESAPRAYRLKASNAASPFSTSIGTIPALIAERERTIGLQQEAIRELSTPVLQIRDRLLILPIIGVLDSQRAKQLTSDLLQAI